MISISHWGMIQCGHIGISDDPIFHAWAKKLVRDRVVVEKF